MGRECADAGLYAGLYAGVLHCALLMRIPAVMNYTEMEAKVREATNNEPWGEPPAEPLACVWAW